ncbi:hypothetical protein GCM10020255_086100 [Rhodococcus baikonurensis]
MRVEIHRECTIFTAEGVDHGGLELVDRRSQVVRVGEERSPEEKDIAGTRTIDISGFGIRAVVIGWQEDKRSTFAGVRTCESDIAFPRVPVDGRTFDRALPEVVEHSEDP